MSAGTVMCWHRRRSRLSRVGVRSSVLGTEGSIVVQAVRCSCTGLVGRMKRRPRRQDSHRVQRRLRLWRRVRLLMPGLSSLRQRHQRLARCERPRPPAPQHQLQQPRHPSPAPDQTAQSTRLPTARRPSTSSWNATSTTPAATCAAPGSTWSRWKPAWAR